jgi:hypothetical protein
VDPVIALEREWAQLAHSLDAHLRGWHACEPALRSFPSVRLLVEFLQQPGADYDAKDAVLAALLRQTQTDRRAGRVVLQALLPGLKRLAGVYIRTPEERDAMWSTLLCACWERICTYPLRRRPQRIAANLLADTRRVLWKERTLALAHAERETPLPDLPLPPLARAEVDVERPLRRAVAAGAITAEEAELIAATRIDGRDPHAVAAHLRVTYNTLIVRRLRAERRLAFFLGGSAVTSAGRKRRSLSARENGAGSEATAQGGV